ncbi:hypothetical protein Lal_00040030 [Lupinus albus]|nr:hypothetical protein Lal_00040030 [Lupinus albus]
MERKTMALKLFLVMAVFVLCMAKVSSSDSNAKIQDHLTDSKVVKGPNRRALPFVVGMSCTKEYKCYVWGDCGASCRVRCSLHSRPNRCNRACGTCCSRCKCVPPGTFGNREICGSCYTDMLTHGNRLKCP